MKKYDREKKKWVTEEEYDKSHKPKKTCKGGKEHDLVLVLPDYVSYVEGKYNFNPERYYEIMDEEAVFFENQAKKLNDMGVKSMSGRFSRYEARYYRCSVCGKKKIKFK